MFTDVIQERQGAVDDENEKEILTPRNLWKPVPRKGKFSTENMQTRDFKLLSLMKRKVTIFIFVQVV